MDCEVVRLTVLSPTLAVGKTRITMTWESSSPSDIDIHTMAIRKTDNSLCKTFYGEKTGCDAIIQDTDISGGGLNGAETVTLLDATVNHEYLYLISIRDHGFENDGKAFLDSGAKISITNGLQTMEIKMEASIISSETPYYFLGCLDVQTGGPFIFSKATNGTIFAGSQDSQWLQMQSIYCQT